MTTKKTLPMNFSWRSGAAAQQVQQAAVNPAIQSMIRMVHDGFTLKEGKEPADYINDELIKPVIQPMYATHKIDNDDMMTLVMNLRKLPWIHATILHVNDGKAYVAPFYASQLIARNCL